MVNVFFYCMIVTIVGKRTFVQSLTVSVQPSSIRSSWCLCYTLPWWCNESNRRCFRQLNCLLILYTKYLLYASEILVILLVLDKFVKILILCYFTLLVSNQWSSKECRYMAALIVEYFIVLGLYFERKESELSIVVTLLSSPWTYRFSACTSLCTNLREKNLIPRVDMIQWLIC